MSVTLLSCFLLIRAYLYESDDLAAAHVICKQLPDCRTSIGNGDLKNKKKRVALVSKATMHRSE